MLQKIETFFCSFFVVVVVVFLRHFSTSRNKSITGGKKFSNSSRIFMVFKSSSGKVECMQQIGERRVRAASQSSYLSFTADGCFLALV